MKIVSKIINFHNRVIGVNKGKEMGFNVLRNSLSFQLQKLMESQFDALENALSRFNFQFGSRINSENSMISEMFQNSLLDDPRLIRDIEISVLSSDDMVRGLGFIKDKNGGSFAFTFRPGKITDSYIVIMNDPKSSNDVIIEEYEPLNNKSTPLGVLPEMREVITNIIPNEIPSWKSDHDYQEFKDTFQLEIPFISKWENFTARNLTEDGYIVSISPLEVTQEMFRRLGEFIPVSVSLYETDNLKLIVTEKSVTSNISKTDYDKANKALDYYIQKYGNLENVNEVIAEDGDSILFLKRFSNPFEWSIIISFKNIIRDIWYQVRNALLGLALGLSFIIAIPLCCIYQSYLLIKEKYNMRRYKW